MTTNSNHKSVILWPYRGTWGLSLLVRRLKTAERTRLNALKDGTNIGFTNYMSAAIKGATRCSLAHVFNGFASARCYYLTILFIMCVCLSFWVKVRQASVLCVYLLLDNKSDACIEATWLNSGVCVFCFWCTCNHFFGDSLTSSTEELHHSLVSFPPFPLCIFPFVFSSPSFVYFSFSLPPF